jgi:hypothetical protein
LILDVHAKFISPSCYFPVFVFLLTPNSCKDYFLNVIQGLDEVWYVTQLLSCILCHISTHFSSLFPFISLFSFCAPCHTKLLIFYNSCVSTFLCK